MRSISNKKLFSTGFFKRNRHGATLLELIIAMFIAAVVITLSLTVFSDILKGFLFQENQARITREMMETKWKIESVLSDIASIQTSSANSITCIKNGNDTSVTIEYKNDTLYIDKKNICNNLKAFIFSFKKKVNYGSWVLLWDAQLKSGRWFGGAAGERR